MRILFASILALSAGLAWGQGAPRPPLPRSQSYFGLHFDIQATAAMQGLGFDVTDQHVAHVLDSAKPDYVTWDFKGVHGYASYPTSVGDSAPGIVKDAIPVWREVTRRHGVALYGYYSGLDDQRALVHHPDWARRDITGKSDGISISTVSPYVSKLMLPQLIEASHFYEPDGYWVDSQCLTAGLDYSPVATAAWQAAYGVAPPTLQSDPNWFAWKQFNRQNFLEHVISWVDGIHQAAPGVEVGSNWTFTAYSPEAVLAKVDYLTGDFSYADGVNTPRYVARYLSTLGLPWDLVVWGFVHYGPSNYYVLPAEAIEQEAAAVLMQGGAVTVYHHPAQGGAIPQDIVQQVSEVGQFCRARQAHSFKSTSVPQVALLLSAQTYFQNCQTSFDYKGEWTELQGVLHGLLELHYSVDVLSENQLKPRLAEFPLVVIPNSWVLSADFVAALTTYVQNGGNLLIVGAKCTPALAALEGVTPVGAPAIEPGFVPTSTPMIADAQGYWQHVTPLAGTQILASRYATADLTGASQIASTIAKVGQGQVLAIYGPLAIDYFNRDRDKPLRQWLADSVHQLFLDPMIDLEGSDLVDLSIRRAVDGKLAIHLLNRTGFSGNPPAPGAVVGPVGAMTLKIRVPKRPLAVGWAPEPRQLQWKWEDGVLTVQIPSLHIHGIVLVHERP